MTGNTSTRKDATRFVRWKEAVVKLNPSARISLVRTGVPPSVLVAASAHFGIPHKQLTQLVGISPATLDRKLKTGTLLGQTESERLERMALIETHAEAVFGSTESARDWLIRRNIVLGDTPLALLDTETGAGEVRKVLSAIAHGGTA